ncbi:MAG: hypothetical protein ACREJM_00015, partial [Candidatus Saccharimonadales bacterium]
MPGNPGPPAGQGVWILNGSIPPVTPSSIPVSPGGAPAGFYTSLQAEAVVAIAAPGDTVAVAAVTGKSIYVTGYNVTLTTAGNLVFTSNPAGTKISATGFGVLSGNEASGGSEPFLFRTAAGQSLVINA